MVLSGFSGDGGRPPAAQLSFPYGVAVGPDGSLYIADRANSRIRRVGPDGIITTVAGNGVSGFSGDGGPATQAQLCIILRASPWDRTAACTSRTPATTASAAWGPTASSPPWRDERRCRLQRRRRAGHRRRNLTAPSGVAVGPDGSLYIADSGNHRIRRVGPDGIITTVAGNGVLASAATAARRRQAQLIAA